MDDFDFWAVVVFLAVVVRLWDTALTNTVAGFLLSMVVERRVCLNSKIRISWVSGERSLCAKVRYFSRRVQLSSRALAGQASSWMASTSWLLLFSWLLLCGCGIRYTQTLLLFLFCFQ